MLKNKKGVTLVELLIVVITVIALSVISAKMYTHQIERTISLDGSQLLRKIADAQMVYYLENKMWSPSFEYLPVEIDGGEYVSSDKKVIKNKDFVFFLSTKAEDGVVYLSVDAMRKYDNTEISDTKRNYYINFTIPSNFNPDNKKYTMKAVTASGATSKDKAVVNYLNKRLKKNK